MKDKKNEEDKLEELLKDLLETKAEYEIGKEFFFGIGVEKNSEEAVRWLTRAAEKGSMEATYLLAFAYIEGMGVKQNFEKAITLFETVIEMGGSADVVYETGCAFFEVAKDDIDYLKALILWGVAATKGHHKEAQLLFGYLWVLEMCIEETSTKDWK